LPALWTGIFYDADALAAAWSLCKDWTTEQRLKLRTDAARLGLRADIAGRSLQDVAKDMVAISRSGLKRRARLNGDMLDESVFLNTLEEIAESGMTPADRLLDLYNGPWRGDVRPVFDHLAY
jgi:glutamate--cysteine ligase